MIELVKSDLLNVKTLFNYFDLQFIFATKLFIFFVELSRAEKNLTFSSVFMVVGAEI